MDEQTKDSHLVAIAYDGRETADEVWHEIQTLEETGDIVLEDAVIVQRHQGNQVELTQLKPKEWKAAKVGTGIGLVAGLLIGGPIVGVMAGAGIGYIAGRLKDHGISDSFIKNLSESLAPDSSAIFLLIREENPEKVLAAVQPFKGHVLTTNPE